MSANNINAWFASDAGIIIVIALLFFSHCQRPLGNRSQLEKIRLVSIEYDIKTIMPVEPSRILSWEGRFDTTIVNSEDLRFLEKRITEIPGKDSGIWDDTRLLFLLYWNNNVVDTLNMAGYWMSFRSQCYRLDTSIVNLAKKYLPLRHVRGIEYRLRNFR